MLKGGGIAHEPMLLRIFTLFVCLFVFKSICRAVAIGPAPAGQSLRH